MVDRALLDKLTGIEARFDELERLIADPANISDYEKVAEYAQERAELQPLVELTRRYKQALDELEQAEALLDDADMGALAREEIGRVEAAIPEMEDSLRRMLLPKDPRDSKNVIVEIRAGAGGDEAGIFAGDLFRMYSRYAEEQRWKVEVLSAHETGVGGYKEIVFEVRGHGAFSRLKYESGVHRVQRVPVTESSGRIHTSTATVAVLPEAEDVELEVSPADLRIDTYRASGAGGQHVNRTESAVRLTHLPTGIVVECQDERSQIKNKDKAMRVLRSRVQDYYQSRVEAEYDEFRKSRVGSGDRSERIRTYNFPENRIADHRTGFKAYNLDAVLSGALDPVINSAIQLDEAQRLKSAGQG